MNVHSKRGLGRWMVGPLVVVSLLLTACGDDDGTAASSPTTEGASSADAGGEASGDFSDVDAVELVVGTYIPETNPHSQGLQWWMDEVEARTDGKVTFDVFWSGTLCPLAELLGCLRDGRVDIAQHSPPQTPSDLPLHSIVTVPYLADNPDAQRRALEMLAEEGGPLAEEASANGARPLYYGPIGEYIIATNSPLEAASDVEGLDVATHGYVADVIEAAGANIAAIAFPEMYESMQRGVIDAFLTTLDGMVSASLFEVSSHWYLTSMGPTTSITTWISEDVFDGLDPKVQQVMLEVSRELSDEVFIDEFFLPADEAACEAVLPELSTFEALPDEVEAPWREAGEQVKDDWLQTVTSQGASDPESFWDAFEAAVDEADSQSDYVSGTRSCVEQDA